MRAAARQGARPQPRGVDGAGAVVGVAVGAVQAAKLSQSIFEIVIPAKAGTQFSPFAFFEGQQQKLGPGFRRGDDSGLSDCPQANVVPRALSSCRRIERWQRVSSKH